MTHVPSPLADRFAGLRQHIAADAGRPGLGLDAVVLALVLRLIAMLERMIRNWEAGRPAAPRFRRRRRGLRPYSRRRRARATPRLRSPVRAPAWTLPARASRPRAGMPAARHSSPLRGLACAGSASARPPARASPAAC